MLPYYDPTNTELLICDLYQLLEINHQHELDIDQIAALWGQISFTTIANQNLIGRIGEA
ncbi:hypothetical protein [Paenibacillus sp. O199]|uniref:hypothetical protein n=1 Tax=Paenibacillus sp. O199 TaxID=1643925 RepID=UPI000AF64595|nr:hypothetical protein [Paenibacillus sp. O199]